MGIKSALKSVATEMAISSGLAGESAFRGARNGALATATKKASTKKVSGAVR